MKKNMIIYILILKISLLTVNGVLLNNSSFYASFSQNFTVKVCLPSIRVIQNILMIKDFNLILENLFNNYVKPLHDVEVKGMQEIEELNCFNVTYEMNFIYSDPNDHLSLIESFKILADENNNNNLEIQVANILSNSIYFKNASLILETSLMEFNEIIHVLETQEICSRNPCKRYHDCSADRTRLNCSHYCDRKDEYCKNFGRCYREVKMEDKPECM
jgi:hypothetical protein